MAQAETAVSAQRPDDQRREDGPLDGGPLPPLWRNRDYMLLWGGQLVSTMGTGISQLALPLLILAITHSPELAGFAGALNALPYLIFSLPAGALVDRWDRKRVMIVCDTCRAINTASIPVAAALGHLTVAQLLVNTTIEGAFFVFFNLAEVACLPRVVPKEQLPNASAQNEGGMITAFLLAPPIGGLLYQVRLLSHTLPWVVDAVSYTASVLSLSWIKTEFQEDRAVERRALREEIVEGLSWLWHQPLIRYMAFLTGGLNFTNSAMGLTLIVIAQHQGASATTIGLMFTIGGVGGILGSIIAPRMQRRFGFGQVIVSMVWIEAILWPFFSVAPNPFLLGLIAALLFATSPIYNAVQFSYRLSLIPDELQGRVNSAFRLLAFGFQPIGAALCGVLIGAIGAKSTVLVFAACVVALAVTTTANPRVRNARPIAGSAEQGEPVAVSD